MNRDTFIEWFSGNSFFEIYIDIVNEKGENGIGINNKRFDTKIHITDEAIEKHDLDALLKATHCGRNVEAITRVTGFFSKVSAWNKGKIAELYDRHRSDVA